MPVNDKIRVPDYNDIRNKIVNVFGTGSGTSGYGQLIRSSAVTESTKVSVNEWGNLRFDIINAYTHIFGTTPTMVVPADGNTIRYSNTFVPDSGASDAPITQYDTYCNQIINNRFTVHPSQSATFAFPPSSTTWPNSFESYWTGKIQTTVVAEWPTADAARQFFNSGGEIRFASSRSGGSTNAQNTSWTSILSSAGVQGFGGNKPGTGTTPSTGTNYFRCTNSFQVWYTLSGSSPYGSNSWRISARTPDVANNSSGTALKVEFLIEWIDNYVDPGQSGLNPQPDTIDAVDGTFNLSVSYLYATGVLVPTGFGNFTVTQPSMTINSIVNSAGAPPPVYTIVPSGGTSVNEGASRAFDIFVSTISTGSVYVKLIGSYEGAGTTATVPISENRGIYTVSIPADLTTEGAESFQVEMRLNSQSGTLVATSAAVTVNDTSVNPQFTTFIVGGGGGGGGQFFDGSVGSGGGGGGSGGRFLTINTVSIGQTISVVVGGGAGGSGYNSNATGGTGGTSIFGSSQATGGTGGMSNFGNPFGGTGGSPNGVNGSPGGFGSFNGGAGGDNGSGYGRGGNGGSNSAGLTGQAGVVRISYPGPRTLAAITGLTATYAFDGTTTTYTFTAGSGSITV